MQDFQAELRPARFGMTSLGHDSDVILPQLGLHTFNGENIIAGGINSVSHIAIGPK